MKKITFSLIVWLFWCMGGYLQTQAAVPQAMAEESFNMPVKDGHQGDKVVNGSLLFYDTGGPTGNVRTGYTGSVCFVPGNPGEKIEITFEEIDLSGDASVQVYDGEVKSAGWKSKPDGYVADLTGQLPEQTFVSGSEDGKLSVNSYVTYSGSGSGWRAVVRSVVPADMSYVGTSAAGYGRETAWPGRKSLPVMAVNVQTEGSSRAFSVSSLVFNLDGTSRLPDIENIKVYYTGSSSVFDTKRLFGEVSGDIASGFTVTGDRKLGSGNNYFWLAADVTTDAVPGGVLAAGCTSVTVDGTEHPCNPAVPEGEPVMIRNIVLMAAGETSYGVGDDPILFYDDGGKDGAITEGFEGSVTFKPTHAGKKVQISFNALDLRLNTGVSNDDMLKIYNGSSAEESSLNTVISRNNPIVVKSTAADGSLTVTLKSVASLPGTGFEALVSEFVPQEMMVSEIVAVQSTEGTVAAGDTCQPVLCFNIRTENTEPALTATTFRFTTEGTTEPSDLTKATLYYTSKEAGFATQVKVGETILSGSAEFDITGTQALTEGDNYFWLAYDLNAQAVSGHVIDAGCLAVTLSGQENVVENGIPEGNRTVKNEYVSKQEAVSKVIYGDWDFTGICRSSLDNQDQTVTFLPGPAACVTELEFSEFRLYFSYSSTPTFEVYSGTEVKADKLLWRVTTSDRTPVLNNPFRPLAGDAAITVRYNQNGAQSSSMYGWKAKVRPYLPRPMVLDGVNVTQKNTDFISGGSTAQEILGFCVTTSGNQHPLTLDHVVVNLKNSQSLIRSVSLYYTGTDSIFASADPVASMEVDGESSGEVTLTPAVEIFLQEGKSYYWIAYDINENVAPDQAVDASLVSVSAGGIVSGVAEGDPEGIRLTKNIYLLRTTGHENLTVGDYSYLFYDDGGKEGKYSSNTDLGTVTFRPSETGKVIKVDFLRFKNSVRDYLEFYNGLEVSEDGLLAGYDGDMTGHLPDPLLSESADGSMTVRFNRQGYSVNDGWELEVSSYIPLPLTAGEVTATRVNKNQLLGGSHNEPLLKIEITVKGDQGSFTFNKLTFDLAGTFDPKSLKETKVYYTGTSDVFSTAVQFGDTLRQPDSLLAFSGETTVRKPGVYYFWLTCDLSKDAVIGDVIRFTNTNAIVNGNETIASVSETAEVTVKDGFHGTYTIGKNGDYKTIAGAIAMLEDGINGPVVFELESGTYDEAVYMGEIKGSSAENTLTFRSKSGNPEDVILTSTQYSAPGYGDDENGVFTVYGTDYLILEGVTLTTEKQYPYLIDIKNASRHVTIRNCRLIREVSSTKYWLIHTGFINKPIANTPNIYLTVENCVLTGGHTGIEIGGAGLSDTSMGGTIRGNVFTDQWSKAIYGKYESQLLIENNRFTNRCGTTSEFDAIDIIYGYEGTCIRNNRIALNLPYAMGIKVRPVSGTVENPIRIYNNEINMEGVNNSSRGISLSSKCIAAEIMYNTIRVAGSAERATGIQSAVSNGSSVTIRNNVVQNLAGGPVFWVNSAAWSPNTVFGHNVLYSSGNSLCRDQATFDEWVAASGASGSVEEQAQFLTASILDLKAAGSLNIGEPSAYVTEDICGTVRSLTTPTAGAYEYIAVAGAPVPAGGYPALKRVTENSAVIAVLTDQHAEAYRLIRTENVLPTADEVLTGNEKVQVVRNEETEIPVAGLESQTVYYPFLVLKSLANESVSEVIACDSFMTAFRRTETATFEQVSVTEGVFEDGTMRFTGFTTESIGDGIPGSYKAARLNENGTIELTNTEKGLPIDGFYLKSDATVQLAVYKGPESAGSKMLAATGEKWVFCNLRDMGELTSVTLSSEGNVLIDDFAGEPQPLQVQVEDQSAEAGEPVTVVPAVDGGVSPFAYEWKNWRGEAVADMAVLTVEATLTRPYVLTVTDAWARTAVDTVLIYVNGGAVTATFDDLALADESHWVGEANPDLTWMDFYSGSYAFSTYYDHQWNSWEGFAYSNETSTVYQWLTDQFRSAAGSGALGSGNYGVAYASGYAGETAIRVLNHAEGDTLSGMYITNSAWAYDFIVNGDDSYEPFKKGDWFKVTATGTAADRTSTSTDFYLADYRSDKGSDHYVLNTWEWFDLRPLGKVTRVVFTVDGSRKDTWGLLIPTYFCLDDVNGVLPVKTDRNESVKKEGSEVFSIGSWFSFDALSAPVTYSLYSLPADSVANASLDGDKLTVQGLEKGRTEWIVSAVQQGRREFVRVVLTVTDAVGLTEESGNGLVVYPVPVRRILHVDTSLEVRHAEVISTYGVRVLSVAIQPGHNSLDVSGLTPGSYILRIHTADGTVSRSFVKTE